MIASDDRCIAIDYTDSTSDKGGQSLLFRSFAERQLFAHFIRLLSGSVVFAAESEWNAANSALAANGAILETPSAILSSCVVHRAETVNSLGRRAEVTVVLDYERRTVAIGGAVGTGPAAEDLSAGAIDQAAILLTAGSPSRLELLYSEPSIGSDLLGPTGGGLRASMCSTRP